MKRLLKILGIAVLVVLVAVVAYVAYVLIDYHRVPDNQSLTVEHAPQTALETETEYQLMTFNMGFGAYEPDFDFFMDGGTRSWAISKERLTQNLDAIGTMLTDESPDLLLVQEVDESGTRTYHLNERQLLTDRLSGYGAVWAENWDSPFLMYPLTQPHGKNRAGLMTFTRYAATSALRRSLPVESSLRKLVDLDRCYSVTRLPVGETELVLYNVHLSAYTSDGTVAVDQLKQLIADMQAEYDAGRYVLCGGDFNKDLLGDSASHFGVTDGAAYTWAQPFPTALLDGTGISLIAADNVPSCRNADAPYHAAQYVVTVDGFLVSDNVTVLDAAVRDTGFRYSDHNPVALRFRLNAEG